jgi:hypothetical protein
MANISKSMPPNICLKTKITILLPLYKSLYMLNMFPVADINRKNTANPKINGINTGTISAANGCRLNNAMSVINSLT